MPDPRRAVSFSYPKIIIRKPRDWRLEAETGCFFFLRRVKVIFKMQVCEGFHPIRPAHLLLPFFAAAAENPLRPSINTLLCLKRVSTQMPINR